MVSAVLNIAWEFTHQIRNRMWRLKNPAPYRVWFLVRRYHTNMIPMVLAFQEAGDQVQVIVETQERIEDHTHTQPVLSSELKASLQTRTAPNPPHIIVIRELSDDMLFLANWGKSKGARVIHYTQKPSRRARGYTAFRQDLTKIRGKQLAHLPLDTITPVDLNPSLPRKLFHKNFNFPVIQADRMTAKSEGILQILLVGKLAQPRKRHFWAIDALRTFQIPCTLLICGAGLDLESDDGTRSKDHYERLMESSKETELNGNLTIEIQSDVPPSDMAALYSSSDIFVLPALNEEFGISVLEAMALGCAVITTNEVGSARHIHNGHNGYVVDSQKETAFRHCLHHLMSDGEARKRIQDSASLTMERHHGAAQFRNFILGRA